MSEEINTKLQTLADDLYESLPDEDPAVAVIAFVNGKLYASHNIDGGDDKALSELLVKLGNQLAVEVALGERTHAFPGTKGSA